MEEKYGNLKELNDKSKSILKNYTENIINDLKYCDFNKFMQLLSSIPLGLKVTYDSQVHHKLRPKNGTYKNQHPIKPIRGQVYNALLGENYGSELSGQHPVIVIQNDTGNLFAHKVNVVAIEGDGNDIDESYMIKITDEDFEDNAKLTKNPSRIIVSEILTLDKARLEKYVGKLKPEKMKEINCKLISQLSLDKQ